MNRLKLIPGVAVIAIFFAGCTSLTSRGSERYGSQRFTDDQKHRLYSAALAASDSPIETRAFTDVCHTIGIFDARGKPNDEYMNFVSRHVDWANRDETEEFRREIDSKEKARAYVEKHLATSQE